jgi:hypothetical protein
MLTWPEDLRDLSLAKDAETPRVRTVAQKVGHVLNSGKLALFIGTGLSAVVRLPMWEQLNDNIVRRAKRVLKSHFGDSWNEAVARKLPTPKSAATANDPLEILDKVEEVCSSFHTLTETGVADPEKFVGNAPSWHAVVRSALYEGRSKYKFCEMFHPELVSLCSILTGGHRGVAREVVTFNYDDVLESYLRLHGQPYHVVTPLPNQLTPNSCTVVYHPHGYLPLEDTKPREPPFLVLSKRSYERMRGPLSGQAVRWRELIAWVLSVRIGLFVGTSGNDEIFSLYFDQAIEHSQQFRDRRPLAFALLLGDYLPAEKWLERHVVPLEFGDANAVARFLSSVCQEAATISNAR